MGTNASNSYDLPGDVFEPGETRPQRTKKSKGAKANEVASKKRSFADTSLEVRHVMTKFS